MPRYIDADALETHEMIIPYGNGMYEDVEVVYMDDIRDMPTADVRENKKGKWVWDRDDAVYHCSECFFNAYGDALLCMDGTFKFCPNCGADMRGG